MAIPFNLADLIKATPANQVVDQNLVNARNMFGIDDDFLLKDYTDYYMDKPPVINTNEGIATLPVNTNVSNQGEGGEGRDDLSIFDIKNKISGDTTKTSTGGISDLQNQLSQGIGMQSIMDAYQDVKDNSGDDVSFEEFMDRTAPFGKNPITGEAYKEPRTIADQNRILGYTFSDPSKFTGITSLRDFLPGGKYSLTGMAISGLKGINNTIQGSNFAKSTSLADYRDMMSYGGYEEREKARQDMKDEAAKIQAELDKVKTSEGDRNMGKDKDKDKKSKGYKYGRDSTPNDPTSTKDTPKSKGYGYANTPGGGQTQGNGTGGRDSSGTGGGWGNSATGGGWCFDPSTPIQMADGSEKKIKEIQLGDNTKGGEVTGVFQFKAADEIHDYKGVTVAGSHFVKEDGKFIMVKDSPLAVKIDKIPVVYSLDTSGRRIFIKDIEFADYNGDGVAKNFLTNAGVNLSGFDKEVLRQVENRLI